MILIWSSRAWAEYLQWQAEDLKIVAKINDLIEEIRRTPFSGTGKPEPLRENLRGFWSRRLTKVDRLVYRVEGKGSDRSIEIAQCRSHY